MSRKISPLQVADALNATDFLRRDGTWALPPTGGGGAANTGWINFVDAGGKVNDATAGSANLTLLHQLLANTTVSGVASNSNNSVGGPAIFFPPGNYDFSGPIRIRKAVRLMGSDGATRAGHNTVFRFPANTQGIILDNNDTDNFKYITGYVTHSGQKYEMQLGQDALGATTTPGTNEAVWKNVTATYTAYTPPTWGASNLLYGTFGSYGSASGTVIDGIYFKGSSTARGTAHGAFVRATVVMRHCHFEGFSGHGIYVLASLNRNADIGGQASNSMFLGCGADTNRLSGWRAEGGDANTMIVLGGDFSNNGDWGWDDMSFLGNLVVGAHSTGNPNPGLRTANDEYFVVSHAGKNWLLRHDQGANGASTTPGTNEAVWTEYFHPFGAPPAWSNTKTYRGGGSFRVGVAASYGCVLGCYAESQQGGMQLSPKATAFGGNHGAGVYAYNNLTGGAAAFLEAYDGMITPLGGMRYTVTDDEYSQTVTFEIGGPTGKSHGAGMTVSHPKPGTGMLRQLTGNFVWFQNNKTVYRLLGNNNALAFGRATSPKDGLHVPNLYVGSDNTLTRKLNYADVAPTSGDHAQGDIVFNTYPNAGNVLGWRCVQGGTPGIWEPMVLVPSIQAFSAARNMVANDINAYVLGSNGTAANFTIVTNATVAAPLGTTITIEQGAAGKVTFAAASGVTIRSRGSLFGTAGQHAVISATQVAANVWTVTGDLA